MFQLPITQKTNRPGIIDLGWGHPDAALLPISDLRDAAGEALDRWGADALNYGADHGPGPLLAWLAERIGRLEGQAPNADQIMITGGVSQALDQICTLHTQPGDIVFVENPTYHLALRILRDHPLELRPISADDQGLRVDALAESMRKLRRTGCRPRLLYIIPTFHNPTGVSLTMERRTALVELAAAEDLLIVEDDVYRDLSYDGAAPPALWQLAHSGTVVRLGSFAKSLAPGMRLGWLTGDAALVGKIADSGLLDSGGGVNHFSAMIITQFCLSGRFDQQVARFRDGYRLRRDALLAGLSEHLPAECSWTQPDGGFFIWVRLPTILDASMLLTHAEAAGVSFIPGTRFHPNGGGAHTLRLAFSLYGPAELTEAARRLGQAIRSFCAA